MNRSDFESALQRCRKRQRELSGLDGDVQTQEELEEQIDRLNGEISGLEDELSQLRCQRDSLEAQMGALPTEEDLEDEDVQGLLSRLQNEERRIKNYISDHFGDGGDDDA